MKLLLAYDGSECSEAALTNLSRAGLPSWGEALVVSAADVILPVGFAGPEETGLLTSPLAVKRAWVFVKDAVEMAQKTAEIGAAKLAQVLPGWRIGATGVGDSPAWAVIKKAEEMKADLIVIGSHGKGLVKRLFLGSVSHRVLQEAAQSVRVGRPADEHAPMQILLALDGSPDSDAVMRAVRNRSWPTGTEFHVVTVVDSQIMSAVLTAPYGGIWYVPDEEPELVEAARRVVGKYAAQLQDLGFKVEAHVLQGEPKDSLVTEADRLMAETIFLGAHGLHHGQRKTLGTVAAAVAARAHCPVEVIRG